MPFQHTLITIDESNLAEHQQVICFINPKHPSYGLKIDWLRKRFKEGMKIKLLYLEGEKRPSGFLEYIPGEQCWRAVSAPGYLFIHCIWINSTKYKHNGFGSLLLQACLQDAASNGFLGVATMTSDRPFMADHSLFLKNGFQEAAFEKPGYRLMVNPLKPGPMPCFRNWRAELIKYHGLHMIYSNQCPWVARFAQEMNDKLRKKGIQVIITELDSPQKAQSAPSPYAVFNLVYNGRLLADHYISETRLNNILKKLD